jgi:hypothetical protein
MPIMDELVDREFQAIRDLIAHNERARDQTVALEREARHTSQVHLDARLDRMNEFRGAMADQASTFITRSEFEEAVQNGISRYEAVREHVAAQLNTHTAQFNARIEPIRSDIERIQRTDWGMLATAGSLFLAVVAGCWLIIGLEIDTKVGPLRVDLEQSRTQTAQNTERLRFTEQAANNSTQADVGSRADRSQLNERVHQLESLSTVGQQAVADLANMKSTQGTIIDRLQEVRSKLATQTAQLIEIETQFCGQDNLRSQIHANDLRVMAMVWKKIFGEEMPISNAFYARVGRCFGPSPASG